MLTLDYPFVALSASCHVTSPHCPGAVPSAFTFTTRCGAAISRHPKLVIQYLKFRPALHLPLSLHHSKDAECVCRGTTNAPFTIHTDVGSQQDHVRRPSSMGWWPATQTLPQEPLNLRPNHRLCCRIATVQYHALVAPNLIFGWLGRSWLGKLRFLERPTLR